MNEFNFSIEQMIEHARKRLITHEQDLVAHVADLITSAEAFEGEFLRQVRSWFGWYVGLVVTNQSERTVVLGTEGVRELKRELAVLDQEAPGLVAGLLEESMLWWHRSRRYTPLVIEGQPSAVTLELLRCACGQLARPLLRFGYLSTDEYQLWCLPAVGIGGAAERLRYPYGDLPVSAAMLNHLMRYEAVVHAAIRTASDVDSTSASIRALETERAARDMWNSVDGTSEVTK